MIFDRLGGGLCYTSRTNGRYPPHCSNRAQGHRFCTVIREIERALPDLTNLERLRLWEMFTRHLPVAAAYHRARLTETNVKP